MPSIRCSSSDAQIMRKIRGVFAAAVAFVLTVSVAIAQAHLTPSRPATPPTPRALAAPVPLPSPIPLPVRTPAHFSGEAVLLSRLAPLPPRTPRNTVTPQQLERSGNRVHTLSATGATITVSQVNDGTCVGANGTVFNVGCDLSWVSSALAPVTDTY